MKNILLLSTLLCFLASCECDENAPLLTNEEISIPDVMVVTGLKYGTFPWNNEIATGIFITFNKEVDFKSVTLDETLFIDGNDAFLNEFPSISGNQILIQCGQFYCLPQDGCRPIVRLEGTNGGGIRSTEDDALDGDGDGKAGGTFIGAVEVDECTAPPFQVSSIFPPAGSLDTGDLPDSLVISIFFTLSVDTNSVIFGENIKLLGKPGNTVVPFSRIEWAASGTFFVRLKVMDPYQFCSFDPDCDFELIIEDSVRSKGGTALDGDYNDMEGGNFSIFYSITG